MTASPRHRQTPRPRLARAALRLMAVRLALMGMLYASALPFGQALPAPGQLGAAGGGALVICQLLTQALQSGGDRDTPPRDGSFCPVCSVLAAGKGAAPTLGPSVAPHLLVGVTDHQPPLTARMPVAWPTHERQPRAPPAGTPAAAV